MKRPPATLAPRSKPAITPDPVLLAVTGMSPAVLTETIWALAHPADGAEAIIPSRVIVLTTTAGRDTILKSLFQPSPALGGLAPWDALRQSLSASGHDLTGRLRFGATADDIRVITAVDPGSGRSLELADLRNPADNEAAADFLLEQVRAIVENPDTPLIASLAGGRKTMGALLYACLTLVGRETDRLTHVLVNEPFDTLRDFWFPAQPGESLTDRQGHRHHPSQAKVDLADVPFVPLRNLFKRELGQPAGRFSLLVENCREEVRRLAGQNVQLTVEHARPELDINGTRLKLAPREHLLLLFLATRSKQNEPAYGAYVDALEPLEEFRKTVVETAPENDWADWRHTPGIRAAFDTADDQDLRKLVAAIRNKLRRAGGNAPLLIPCLPEKGRFSLAVPGELIHLKS